MRDIRRYYDYIRRILSFHVIASRAFLIKLLDTAKKLCWFAEPKICIFIMSGYVSWLQICRMRNSYKTLLLFSIKIGSRRKVMWEFIAETVIVAIVTKVVDSLMED